MQWEVFFDQQSRLIAAEKGTLAGVPLEIYYDDWRTANGIKIPYKMEIHRGAEVYAVSVTRAVTDETIGEESSTFR